MADNTPAASPLFEETFDYVIAGAGSAGFVLAARLTEDPAVTVKVLEAGGSDNSLHIQMPAAFAEPLMDHRYNWWYDSAPEPHMDHRRMYCPRGKVLGGPLRSTACVMCGAMPATMTVGRKEA